MDPVMNEWIIECEALREKLARRDALLRRWLAHKEFHGEWAQLFADTERELGDSHDL